MILRRRFAIAVVVACVLAGAAPAHASEVVTVGWIEKVRLGREGVTVVAKLDTGALTSSLHAKNVEWTARDDGDWVSFEVIGAHGTRERFERKVVRVARIKRPTGDLERRPTVLMAVCLGRVFRLSEVNLTDRSGFNYEFLVGRSFLAGRFAVDSSRTYTAEPRCAGKPSS
jgi:hypothetical protein